MRQSTSEQVLTIASTAQTKTKYDSQNPDAAVSTTEKSKGTAVSHPFHLSMCVNNLDSTRHFYRDILGVEERRASKTSVHFDFFGCQLTFHAIPGYTAKNVQMEVDAEDVPVPHFGVALTVEEFESLKERLIAHEVNFLKQPRLRFVGKPHEQNVMFIEDPSGNGIEIKSFTKAPAGTWA
ncbi:MAG: VOC family protein [Coleofasciculaceae cyanobacterium]